MKTINTLIMKLKEGEIIENVYPNEEYVFFVSNLKSIKNQNIEIETDIASSFDVDLKVISINENKLLIEDRDGVREWFIFIDEDGLSRLYLSELKNNDADYKDLAGHFDITVKNEDIIKRFEITRATV